MKKEIFLICLIIGGIIQGHAKIIISIAQCEKK